MNEADRELLEATRASLERVQGFDVQSLVRRDELGAALAFTGIVKPAERLVGLLDRISSSALQDIPSNRLHDIQQQADAVHNLFDQVLEFTAAQGNPQDTRDSLIDQTIHQYQPCFDALHGLIAYSHYRSADFQALEREAREAKRKLEESLTEGQKKTKAALDDINQVLAAARSAAAEQGVSQQAVHFGTAAGHHKKDSETWRTLTACFSGVLLLVAVVFLFDLGLDDVTETPASIQRAIGKVLVFATLSYAVYLSARNFLAQRHNEIVNKHRQNALLTYTTLAEAAHDDRDRDVVLTYAAACIFGPQPTGYTKDGGEASTPPHSVIGLVKDAAS